MIHMRTTLNLDEDLYNKVAKETGITEKTRLIHMGLESLLQKAAMARLASFYGAYPKAKAPRRRKAKW